MELENLQSYPCPHCGQQNEIILDCTGGSPQKQVTDCSVCCRPIVIEVRLNGGMITDFRVEKENF